VLPENKNDIVIYKATNLTLNFPENDNKHIETKVEKTKKSIQNDSLYTSDGRVWTPKKSLPNMLATDSKAINRFYNDLNNDDKLENGSEKYVSIEATQKELSKRIQEPRDTNEKDRLKYSEKAIITLRDAPEIEKIREQFESHIRKELPKVKEKKRKLETEDYVTGNPLTQPEAHHIERVADNPRKALDENNIVVVNKEIHQEIHREDAESKEELEELKKKWNKNK